MVVYHKMICKASPKSCTWYVSEIVTLSVLILRSIKNMLFQCVHFGLCWNLKKNVRPSSLSSTPGVTLAKISTFLRS